MYLGLVTDKKTHFLIPEIFIKNCLLPEMECKRYAVNQRIFRCYPFNPRISTLFSIRILSSTS